MMKANDIRDSIERGFNKILKNEEKAKVEDIKGNEAYGHLAGTPIEEWVKNNLSDILQFDIYYPNEFLELCFSKIGKSEGKIVNFLSSVWWGKLLATKKQIKSFISGKKVNRWQQEGADIVIFCGKDVIKDAKNTILLNVKSHEITRHSRPPNIMSAQRLLEYFDYLLEHNKREVLDDIELWFLGVSYISSQDTGKIKSIIIKDLFKLDIKQVPQINFDAAIQIQWHVEDMKEVTQTKPTFILSLVDEFMKRWNHHSKNKQRKYEAITKKLKNRLLEPV